MRNLLKGESLKGVIFKRRILERGIFKMENLLKRGMKLTKL